MVRIKYISPDLFGRKEGKSSTIERDGCLFIQDANCQEYDWLAVYDEFPRRNIGDIVDEVEWLKCPREHTILITAEPPSIRIYPRCYTRQFAHVLTTHLPQYLSHPGHHFGEGCMQWMIELPRDVVFSMPEYPKTLGLSTVCSHKRQHHTLHYQRFMLTRYLAERLPDMDWFGHGVRPLDLKYKALCPYRYHLAVENYRERFHWSDKISDPILALCLTFYAGDPRLGDILPSESFIPVPLDDPAETLRIIRTAMNNHEYEKRLPAIREARRLIVEKYNVFNRTAELIHKQMSQEKRLLPQASSPVLLKGRHRLRRNPINLLNEGWDILRGRLLLCWIRLKHSLALLRFLRKSPL